MFLHLTLFWQGFCDYDPAQSVKEALPKQSKVQKHRKALHYSEVAGCIAAIKSSNAGDTTKLALEFLILTAARSGEIRNACWDEINLEVSPAWPCPVWSVPAARMKAKRAHTVPLPNRAIAILIHAKGLSDGSEFVFPGTSQGKTLSDMTLSKLVKQLGFDADVHGFRTSFKTWAQERTDFANEVSEMALAHTIQNKAEAAYARSDLIEKRNQMMDQWAEYLAG